MPGAMTSPRRLRPVRGNHVALLAAEERFWGVLYEIEGRRQNEQLDAMCHVRGEILVQ
jgi:hypothetical protein